METRLIFLDSHGFVITMGGRRRIARDTAGCLRIVSRSDQANPVGHSTVRDRARAFARKVRNSTLPRKASKENPGEPYHKPTQVDEENIQRRS